ncbi:uncharacterized protein PGTG_00805 [Puccinia graminis f. sp. tritici CRL 75-36-700-3]|uniref:Uncharacterized protein n=1 Tax=Puccinia graminis f. sp. tritici (strain CRL 75-36-700-3 / race SCCL) TaxID=418459 RepID=E3JTW5_PUCGT|nr:uncharacterized protein PGTG_00805 [Puccinia graminis f. sp. tritici CRL 75-36-700-3]EFP75474.1 hypothetical protein PGTG_00805 [Puccinia graminis f. sp. tritici CRL 75-36-700-3]
MFMSGGELSQVDLHLHTKLQCGGASQLEMVTLHPDIRADADIRLLFPGKAASASASGYPPPWRVSERISSDTRPLNGRRGLGACDPMILIPSEPTVRLVYPLLSYYVSSTE